MTIFKHMLFAFTLTAIHYTYGGAFLSKGFGIFTTHDNSLKPADPRKDCPIAEYMSNDTLELVCFDVIRTGSLKDIKNTALISSKFAEIIRKLTTKKKSLLKRAKYLGWLEWMFDDRFFDFNFRGKIYSQLRKKPIYLIDKKIESEIRKHPSFGYACYCCPYALVVLFIKIPICLILPVIIMLQIREQYSPSG